MRVSDKDGDNRKRRRKKKGRQTGGISGPLGGVLLLSKALAVVSLEGKELFEVGLAVVLARE